MNNDKLIEIYIGGKKDDADREKRLDWYKKSFEHKKNIKGITWRWSWGAFFGSWLYLLYRKCYVEAVIYFLIADLARIMADNLLPHLTGTIGGSRIFISILSGGLLHNLVYRRFLRVKDSVEKHSEIKQERKDEMEKLGGTSPIALIFGIVIYILFIIATPYIGK